ncbi:MAG: hypothetical protein MI919_19010, partial [Holophagales bacterium]|nr:hypothetical protein [Holophagales bacterium]
MAKPQDLLDALGGLEPPSPPACFVLLWTYFSARKIGEVESELHGKGIADGQLPNFISSDSPGRKEPREAIEGLRRLAAHASTSGPFDRAALEWLILLDQELGARGVGKWRNVEMQGLDGKCWRLFDRNNWLGRELLGEEERLTGPGVQGRSLFPYARKLIAVRHVPDQGYEINARSLAPRASVTQTRLRQACGHGRLRILCWPFRPRLHHPELSDLRNLPKVARLYSLANEEEAIEDARAAVSRASESETTILLLPELSATAAVESAVKDELRRLQPCGAPALTLLGLCHRPHERDDAGSMKDVNEAVLLDAAGRELHRHRKLTCFQLWRQGCTEGTLLGS